MVCQKRIMPMTRPCLIEGVDAVQMAAAVAAGAEVIVTRNTRHFAQSPIRVCTPADFLLA